MLLNIENFKLIELDSVDSTNSYAKNLVLTGKSENAVITAKTQTAGRTTKSNSCWASPVGNLYWTAMIKLLKTEERFFPQLSFLSAISLIEAIVELSPSPVDIKIKWPNDILLNIQKLSGILIEKEGDFAIIGIGVNVISSPVGGEIKYPVTSLLESGVDIDKKKLSSLLIKNLITNIKICKRDKFEKILSKAKPFMYKMGEEIFISFNDENIKGIFESLDENGAIIIQTESDKRKLLSGEMTKENFI